MNKRTKNRLDFTRKYGKRTSSVIKAIVQGQDERKITRDNDIWLTSLDAYRANLTRGTYYPWVYIGSKGRPVGTCGFHND